MFVKLWLIERLDSDTAVCCGAYVTDCVTESFRGTDKSRPPPEPPDSLSILRDWEEYKEQYHSWEAQFINSEEGRTLIMSATILLGSTGWSGDWFCTYDDLTDSGKALYDLMQKLYPECDLHLATFLDT